MSGDIQICTDSANLGGSNIELCPDLLDPNEGEDINICPLGCQELTLTGPVVVFVGAEYTANGGEGSITYSFSGGSISQLGVVTSLDDCTPGESALRTVSVTDACDPVQTAELTVKLAGGEWAYDYLAGPLSGTVSITSVADITAALSLSRTESTDSCCASCEGSETFELFDTYQEVYVSDDDLLTRYSAYIGQAAFTQSYGPDCPADKKACCISLFGGLWGGWLDKSVYYPNDMPGNTANLLYSNSAGALTVMVEIVRIYYKWVCP